MARVVRRVVRRGVTRAIARAGAIACVVVALGVVAARGRSPFTARETFAPETLDARSSAARSSAANARAMVADDARGRAMERAPEATRPRDARGDFAGRARDGDDGTTTTATRDAMATARTSTHGELSVPEAWVERAPKAARGRASCAAPGEAREATRDATLETTACAHLAKLRSEDSAEFGFLVVYGGTIDARVRAAKASGARAVLVATTSETEKATCETAGVPSHLPSEGASRNEGGWMTAAVVLQRGHAVALASSTVKFASNPLTALLDDGADVSATIRGDGKRSARVQGMADPAMGWSQYSQSMVIPLIRTTFVVLRPTRATYSLVHWLASEASDFDGSDDALTDEILLPAHDARQRAGVSFRLLNSECFAEKGSVAHVPDGSTHWDGQTTDENAVVAQEPNFKDAKAHVMRREKCGIVKADERIGPKPRELRYIAEPEGEYPVACDEFADLCEVVRKVARNREVLAAVSNKNIFHMLELYIDGLKRTGITNYVIVALDSETADWCKQREVPYYHRELTSITGSTDNHATSGLKFRVLNEFVSTGTSVLLSDVDVVWMQDPFAAGESARNKRLIYRDADVEGMTDGWDDPTSYGFSWNGQRRLIARNSGLFFVAATHETKAMMSRLAERMASEKNTWDQTAYNEEQVYLWGQSKHKKYSGTSQRVMNYMCFQNSKYMFRFMRYDEDLYPDHRPASVHINYHPEKPDRMVSVIAQYWKGEANAIDVWNWSEGRKGAKECKLRAQHNGIDNSPLALAMSQKTETAPGSWGGNPGLVLHKDGTLDTPWGKGKWGIAPAQDGSLFMDFIGAAHILSLVSGSPDDDAPTFVLKSKRCTDGDEVEVKI
jgi:hypothetical protein